MKPEFMPQRRRYLLGALALGFMGGMSGAQARTYRHESAEQLLQQLEARAGGRLGVFSQDTGSGRRLAQRADERFGMCSTFKLLLAAVVLREADAGRLALSEVLRFDRGDLVPHAPVVQAHLDRGQMTVEALAKATQQTSDNVAANLLIRRLGGPAAVTTLFRALGDEETRLDRLEPEMNLVLPGDERDTTTPRAIAMTLARLMTTDLLKLASRETLRQWMIDTQTGARRIRAGLPREWIAGDKTGTGSHASMASKYNDVAIAWPPDRAPIVIATYYEAPGSFETVRARDEAVLAQAAQIVADALSA